MSRVAPPAHVIVTQTSTSARSLPSIHVFPELSIPAAHKSRLNDPKYLQLPCTRRMPPTANAPCATRADTPRANHQNLDLR